MVGAGKGIRSTTTDAEQPVRYARCLPPLSELSGDEERMLFELRALWEKKGSLSVADAYDLSAGHSASTSYRQLIALIDCYGFFLADCLTPIRRERRAYI